MPRAGGCTETTRLALANGRTLQAATCTLVSPLMPRAGRRAPQRAGGFQVGLKPRPRFRRGPSAGSLACPSSSQPPPQLEARLGPRPPSREPEPGSAQCGPGGRPRSHYGSRSAGSSPARPGPGPRRRRGASRLGVTHTLPPVTMVLSEWARGLPAAGALSEPRGGPRSPCATWPPRRTMNSRIPVASFKLLAFKSAEGPAGSPQPQLSYLNVKNLGST